MNVPIVVVAYNRLASLMRLLSSLENAKYPGNVQLIISVDKSDTTEIETYANKFKWSHGRKQIIMHKEHLGLKSHILFAGDLSYNHDGVIVLEDDLFVSPHFYDYAISAASYYGEDSIIAGVSLYSHSYNETARLPFIPLQDESDVFFMQVPSSWGQFWTKDQWSKFRSWYDEKTTDNISVADGIPNDVAKWPDSSWKKYFFHYLIKKNKYFVYPRFSLTTNFGDPGVHFPHKIQLTQVPLLYGKRDFQFKKFSDSFVVYDSFCEVLPSVINLFQPSLKKYEYTVDLYGSKSWQNINTEYLITSRRCSEIVLAFGRELKPIESNILMNIHGNDIFLAPHAKCSQEHKPFQISEKLFYYFFQFHKYQIDSIIQLNKEKNQFEEIKRQKDVLEKKTHSDLLALKHELHCIKKSCAYKISQALTWPLTKLSKP